MHRQTLLGLLATTGVSGAVGTTGAATDCEARIVEEEFDVYEDCESEELHGVITVERLDCEDPLSARAQYTAERRGFVGLEVYRTPMSRVGEASDGSIVSFEVSTSVEGHSTRDFSVQVLAHDLVVDERSPRVPEHSRQFPCG